MEKMLINKVPRINVVDALRGFAVLAILLVHNIEHFIYPVYPTGSSAWLEVLDKGVRDVVFSLFAGKAYAIFALLFGFTFYIQSKNQQMKGADFGYRFLWRLLLLLLFATLNALFFPGGDVLLLFAVVGTVLFVVRHWSDKAILLLAIFFLLQPMEWYHYVRHLADASYVLPDYGVGAMYYEVYKATESGSLWEFISCNVTLGQKASFMWAVGGGRLFQTAGLFLIGCYMGRKELFVIDGAKLRMWIKVLIIAAVCFALLHSLHSLIVKCGSMMEQTVGVVFDMWQKLAFTFVLIASFILLYQSKRVQGCVGYLEYYGRMSLTNYVSQSVLGAVIYFPVALNLAPYCGYTVSLIVAFAVFALQLYFCKWWLKNHRQGPLEALWHKLTWFKR